MNEVDFSAALDANVEDLPEPKDPPQGTYIWSVNKVPAVSTTNSGEWTIVEFPLQAVSAEADVDEDDLADFGDVGSIFNRISFMAPTAEDKDNDRKKTLKAIRNFLTRTLRIEVEDGMTLRQMLDASVNHQFLGQVVWEPKKDDPEVIYVNVKNYAPLD